MNLNLDSAYSQILAEVKSRKLAIFYGEPRSPEMSQAVYWDVEQHPDYREFLDAAAAAGVTMVAVHSFKFAAESINEALDELEESELDRQERRDIEASLLELRKHEGRVANIELAFHLAGCNYIFDLRTPWYDEFGALRERIDESFDESGGEEPLGPGYYSKN
jgi:hypothetical protein